MRKHVKKQFFSHEKTVIFLPSGHGFTLPKKDKKQVSQALLLRHMPESGAIRASQIVFILQTRRFFVLQERKKRKKTCFCTQVSSKKNK